MQERHPLHGVPTGKVQPMRLVEEWQTIQAYMRADTPAVVEAENLHDESN